MGLFLSLAMFIGCSVAAHKDAKVLLYENKQIVKDYEEGKNELSNPQIDKTEGYCPTCEL